MAPLVIEEGRRKGTASIHLHQTLDKAQHVWWGVSVRETSELHMLTTGVNGSEEGQVFYVTVMTHTTNKICLFLKSFYKIEK